MRKATKKQMLVAAAVLMAVCANSLSLAFPAFSSPWALPCALNAEGDDAYLVIPEEDMAQECPMVFAYLLEMLQATQLNKEVRKDHLPFGLAKTSTSTDLPGLGSVSVQNPSFVLLGHSPSGCTLLRI